MTFASLPWSWLICHWKRTKILPYLLKISIFAGFDFRNCEIVRCLKGPSKNPTGWAPQTILVSEFADGEKDTENNINFPARVWIQLKQLIWALLGNLVRRINHLKQLFSTRLIFWGGSGIMETCYVVSSGVRGDAWGWCSTCEITPGWHRWRRRLWTGSSQLGLW